MLSDRTYCKQYQFAHTHVIVFKFSGQVWPLWTISDLCMTFLRTVIKYCMYFAGLTILIWSYNFFSTQFWWHVVKNKTIPTVLMLRCEMDGEQFGGVLSSFTSINIKREFVSSAQVLLLMNPSKPKGRRRRVCLFLPHSTHDWQLRQCLNMLHVELSSVQ